MVLYLPGFGIHNKSEMESISSTLHSNGFDVLTHEWRHWKDESVKWDVNAEIELIKQEIGTSQVDSVVAKSLGSYVSATMVWQKVIDPQKVVLMGVPLNDLSTDEKEFVGLAIKRMSGKLTVIQNSQDEHCSLEDLNFLIANVQHDLIIKESNTHEYNYPEEVLKVLQS